MSDVLLGHTCELGPADESMVEACASNLRREARERRWTLPTERVFIPPGLGGPRWRPETAPETLARLDAYIDREARRMERWLRANKPCKACASGYRHRFHARTHRRWCRARCAWNCELGRLGVPLDLEVLPVSTHEWSDAAHAVRQVDPPILPEAELWFTEHVIRQHRAAKLKTALETVCETCAWKHVEEQLAELRREAALAGAR